MAKPHRKSLLAEPGNQSQRRSGKWNGIRTEIKYRPATWLLWDGERLIKVGV